jgi:hypothetical protein
MFGTKKIVTTALPVPTTATAVTSVSSAVTTAAAAVATGNAAVATANVAVASAVKTASAGFSMHAIHVQQSFHSMFMLLLVPYYTT